EPGGERKTRSRGPLVAAALVLLAAGATVFFALNKGRTPPSSLVAEMEEPGGPKPPVAKKKEPPADPDRRAAEWALQGGLVSVVLGSPEKRIDLEARGKLPAAPFKVVHLQLTRADDTELEVLRPLEGLVRIGLDGAGVTDAGLERLGTFPAAGRYLVLR